MSTKTIDPVHYLRVPMRLYNGTLEPPGWYVWDTDYSTRRGPFNTEQEARKAREERDDAND